MKKLFHKCPMCSTKWKTHKKFLSDQLLEFNGFQHDGVRPNSGFLLFTHYKKGCGSTLAVNVKKFSKLFFRKKETKKRKKD